MKRATVHFDPNVRLSGGLTYASFDDVDTRRALGDIVNVLEPESGLAGLGEVSRIDPHKRLLWLKIRWADLRFPDEECS